MITEPQKWLIGIAFFITSLISGILIYEFFNLAKEVILFDDVEEAIGAINDPQNVIK